MDLDVTTDATALPIRRTAVIVAAVFVAVFVAARVSETWELDAGRGQPLWLASGIAVGAALVVRRSHRGPAVLAALAALTANSAGFVRSDVGSVLCDLTTSSIEIFGGLLIFAMLFRGREGLGRSHTTLVAFILCFAIPAVAGGVAVVWFGPDNGFDFWWSWTLGNGLGMAAAGSLLLLARGPGNWLLGGDPGSNAIEFAVATVVTGGLVAVAFETSGQLTYLVVASLLWLAVRFGPRIGVPAALATVIYACLRSSAGMGPFGGGTTSDLLNLQAFNAAVVLSTSLIGRYARGIDRERRRNDTLVTTLPDLVTVSSSSGRITVLSADEQVRRGAAPILDWIGRHADVPGFGEPRTQRYALEVEGETRFMESRSLRIDRQGVLTVSRDITEPVRLMRDMQAAQERWQRLATTAYEGFLEVDRDTRVVYATPRLADMLAAEVDDLIGVPFPQLFEPEDYATFEHHAVAVLEGERVVFETAYHRRDGERAWCIVSGEPLRDEDGEFAGAIMFAAETTAFHQVDESRAVAEMRLASFEQTERQRIARQLHDGPLQSLVALSYQLHALTKGADVEATASRLEALAIDAVRSMRLALDDLSPNSRRNEELGPALRSVAARFESQDTPAIVIESDIGPAIPERVGSGLYLIGREAIINAILHASATTIRVSITESDRGYELLVEDDGLGLGSETGDGDRNGHLGLRAMHERATEAGGACEVSEVAPHGTRVRALLPREIEPAGVIT